MAKIVRHKNEQVNTKVRIWIMNPDKSSSKKFHTPVKTRVHKRTTMKV